MPESNGELSDNRISNPRSDDSQGCFVLGRYRMRNLTSDEACSTDGRRKTRNDRTKRLRNDECRRNSFCFKLDGVVQTARGTSASIAQT